MTAQAEPRYFDNHHHQILKELRLGNRLDRLSVPSDIVSAWRQASRVFDAEVRAAIFAAPTITVPETVAEDTPSAGKSSSHSKIGPGWQPEVLRRLREGASTQDLGDGCPSRTVLQRYRRSHPDFDAACREAINASGKKFAKRFDQATAKQSVLAALRVGGSIYTLGPGYPSPASLDNWRRVDPEFDREVVALIANRPRVYFSKAETKAAILEELKKGIGIYRLRDGLPAPTTIDNWRKADPDFDEAVRSLIVARRVAKRKPKLVRPVSMPIQFQAKQSNALYAAADKAVGRHHPPDVRDDIITDIVILVLDGEFGMDDIKGAAKKATTAYWKGREGFRQRSMDAPLSSGDTRTLQDMLGGF